MIWNGSTVIGAKNNCYRFLDCLPNKPHRNGYDDQACGPYTKGASIRKGALLEEEGALSKGEEVLHKEED